MKKYLYTIAAAASALCFTVYIALDTFVIPKAYVVVNEEVQSVERKTSENETAENETVKGTADEKTEEETGEETAKEAEKEAGSDIVKEEAEETATEEETAEAATEEETIEPATEEETTEPEQVETVITDNSYTDGNISILITEYRINDTNVYVADITLSSPDYLSTAFA
nr:hypothetical protein [Lachnospiraceae bacterium]